MTPRLWSLWDMLDLNASAFLGAATNLARIHEIFAAITAAYHEPLTPDSCATISKHVTFFKDEVDKLGARLSVVAAERLLAGMAEQPCQITVGKAVTAINEIESRFADYLTELKMFVLDPAEGVFLGDADSLIDAEGFAARFPSAAFEVEEAAKCVVLGRHTASVFHAMRVLEVGIRAFAKRLGIPDPTKPAEKNWALILKAIKDKIDELWPANKRLPESEGAAFEALYATLDAVRNPWRNATMHVETIYAPHEALHIIRCSAFFLRRLSELTDENGNPPPDPTLAGVVPEPS